MVKTLTIPEKLKPVEINDLTVDQIEAIEDETGLTTSEFKARGGVKLYRLLLAAGNGIDPDALKGLTLRQLVEMVSGSDPNP